MPATAFPSSVPRWADGGTNTPTNVVQPPEHSSSIPAWAAGPYAVADTVVRAGNEYIVLSIAGTGTSTTGPTGTGTTTDNPGANQVVWGFVTATPITKDSGWLPNTQPPAQWFNWIHFWTYQWILWVLNLPNQLFSSTGTNGVGPWTARHEFTGGADTLGPAVKVTAGGTGTTGIDATGGAGSGITNPGPGLVGRGGAGSGGLGAAGVQGYGSGVGQGGLFTGAPGSGSVAGADGLYSTGGLGANGATCWGGAAPTGGGTGCGVQANGAAGTGGTGLEANGGEYLGGLGGGNGAQCSSGGGNGIGCIGIGTGTGAGLAGVSFGGSGPGVQGDTSTGTGPAMQANPPVNGTGLAILQNGQIVYSGTRFTPGTDPGHNDSQNALTGYKAWGLYSWTGTAISLLDNYALSAAVHSFTINSWANGHAYTVSTEVYETTSGSGIWSAQNSGTSGGSNPFTGGPTPGTTTVNDNGITWLFLGVGLLNCLRVTFARPMFSANYKVDVDIVQPTSETVTGLMLAFGPYSFTAGLNAGAIYNPVRYQVANQTANGFDLFFFTWVTAEAGSTDPFICDLTNTFSQFAPPQFTVFFGVVGRQAA